MHDVEGMVHYGPMSQRSFLQQAGIHLRLKQCIEHQPHGAFFTEAI